MTHPNGSGGLVTDPRVHELVVVSDELQERSVQIQDRATRTSGLIANTSERSHNLIMRMQRAGHPTLDLRLRDVKVCLDRQTQYLNAVERSLDVHQWSRQAFDREEIKASILRSMREVETLTMSLQTMVHDAVAHIERELNLA